MCAFSMGHPLEIYAPYLRERKRERDSGKEPRKRINKIREFTNQFNVLNSTQPKVNLNLNLNDKFSTAKKSWRTK